MTNPEIAKPKRKYPMFLIILFVILIVASAVFLLTLLKLTLEDADFWLRPLTGALVFFTAVAGVGSLFTGYVLGNKLELRLAAATKDASDAKARADQEAVKRLELEKSLMPRWLPIVVSPDGKSNLDSLKPFQGQVATLEFLPEAESRRAVNELKNALNFAGWEVRSVEPNPDLWSLAWDGVTVEVFSAVPEKTPRTFVRHSPAMDVADALVALLKANEWDAKSAPRIPIEDIRKSGMPPESLRIRVGIKPKPYLEPEHVKDPMKGLEGEKQKAEKAAEVPAVKVPKP